MARKPLDGRIARLCADEQGSDDGGKRISTGKQPGDPSEEGPMVGPPVQPAAASGASGACGKNMSHRILVVEDNAVNLELLVDWLESEKFQVQTAATLDEAFSAFRGELPETVLLDVQLG